MGMCKGCNGVYSSNEMKNGFCNECISKMSSNDLKNKAKKDKYKVCQCGGSLIPYKEGYMMGVPFSSFKELKCNKCNKSIRYGCIIMAFMGLFFFSFMLYFGLSSLAESFSIESLGYVSISFLFVAFFVNEVRKWFIYP